MWLEDRMVWNLVVISLIVSSFSERRVRFRDAAAELQHRSARKDRKTRRSRVVYSRSGPPPL